jgi:Fe-S-cluster-containing dehydrogenase component
VAQYRLFIDYDLCFGCYACEVACKQENQLPVGPKWISVKTVGPKMAAGKLVMDFIPMTCRHCSNAPCITACPEDAITKRNDGIVLITSELCIGCLACIEVCPFGAPQFNAEREIVEKCHLCHHRLDRGLQPACVQACPAGAISYGDMNGITENLRQRLASRLSNK